MVKKIIDVSFYQGDIDFSKVKNSGIDGAIIRCGYTGYGTLQQNVDVKFEEYYKGFKAVGMPVGVYYYSSANTVELAKKEANFVLNLIKNKQLEYPVYFDTENEERQRPLSRQALTDITKAFCEIIEGAGYYVGIYASTSWFNDELDCAQLTAYDKWVAQYNTECTFNGDYGMWQYTSSGRVDGINGNVDIDHCYYDYPTIIKNTKLNGWVNPPVIDFKAAYNDIKLKYDTLLAQHKTCATELKNSQETINNLKNKMDQIKSIASL